jgi:hypothetical protein
LQQANEIQEIIPSRKASELPPFPLIADDYYIYVDHIQQQPQGQLSALEGFDFMAHVYSTGHSLLMFDIVEDKVRQSENTRAQEASAIKDILYDLDGLFQNAHPELASPPNPTVFEAADESVSPQQTRLHIRCEAQKILIRSALISTKYCFTERLAAAVQRSDDTLVQKTRQKCMYDLADLAATVTRASLEPVAKLVLPQLERVWGELRKLPAGIAAEHRDIEYLEERAPGLFGGW